MSNRAIVVENLVKEYKGGVRAVNDISLHVHSGEIFGFLGPNGAGKSTTVSMLTTLMMPTSGHATVGSYDIVTQAEEVRRVAGVALQEVGIDPMMRSMELLMLQGQLFGMSRAQAKSRAEELLHIVKLEDVTNRRVGQYSGGMRRRLDLAMALVHRPSVLFLDEPTTGLDPASRRDIWTEVRRLNQQTGMTIFLTTQYLEEADQLANRVAIISKGVIAAEGQPAELKAQMGGDAINLSFALTADAENAGRELSNMTSRMQVDGAILRLYMADGAAAIPTVVSRLQNVALLPLSLTLTQPTLDDVFLKVTGQRFSTDAGKEQAA